MRKSLLIRNCILSKHNNKMTERKPWSQQEDRILIETVSNQPEVKWSLVADSIKSLLPNCQRTPKQCRDRWRNQLDPLILNNQWKAEQQRKLFQLHKQFGNKWAVIARELQGRTDNSVKNHYYCGLRKSVRKFNRSISSLSVRWKFRSITESILTKILHVATNKRPGSVSPELVRMAVEIERKLFEMSLTQQALSREMAQQLGDMIEYFHTNLKGKRGRRRKNKKKEESFEDQIKEVSRGVEGRSVRKILTHSQRQADDNQIEAEDRKEDEQPPSTHQEYFSQDDGLVMPLSGEKPMLELPIALENALIFLTQFD